MGQAVLVQHGFQRINFGGNIHANILQKDIVQLFICRIQGVQDTHDIAPDFLRVLVALSPNPSAVFSSLRVVGI